MTITDNAQPKLPLSEQIAEEIKREGPISFARFMELALYAPGRGYYERSLNQTGREGDFYTSVSVGALFGELIGYDLARKLRTLEVQRLHIVEAGAHDGQLANDILTYLKNYSPDILQRIDYLILEPSPVRQEAQRRKLAEWGPAVNWSSNWDEHNGPIHGAIISNELLDAMPVHVFRWNRAEKCWREWGVTFETDRFGWVMLPSYDAQASGHLKLPRITQDLAEVLPDGFSIDVSPGAIDWWRDAATRLKSGWLMTFDYGLTSEQIIAPERAAGTLRSYSRHHHGLSVLENPGEQDITYHVNFSSLKEEGEALGLKNSSLQPQGSHFKSLIESIHLEPGQFPAWTPARLRQLASLVHPEHLGRAFKTLVQERSARQYPRNRRVR